MNGKLYIKKFIRDDGETLSFDAEEIYLSKNNTLLVRSDPATTAVEFTEEDGGEMIRQRGATYSQPVSGLIVPKSTEYWALCVRLSRFFILNHTYKIVYIKRDGSMFSMNRAWINAGLQIVPVPYENYSTWTIEFRIGDNFWTEYAEDSQGKEIYSNSVELPLLTAGTGGEVWSDAIQQTLSGLGNYFTIDGTSISASINKLEVRGDTYQQTYSGYNLIDLVPTINTQPTTSQQCTFETVMDTTLGRNVLHVIGTTNYPTVVYQLPQRLESGKYYALKFTYRSAVSGSPQNDTMWFAPNWTSNYWDVLGSLNSGRAKSGDGDTVTSTGQSTTWKTTSRRFYVVPSQHSATMYSYTHICFSLGYNSNATKELWLADAEVYEITEDEWNADTYTSKEYEPYVGGIASPNPDYPQDVQVVTGEQTITITDGTNTQNFTVDLGATELCKISDYQDYIYKSGDDWYLHKETNAKTIDGTEVGWGKSRTTSNNAYYLSTKIFDDIDKGGMGVGVQNTNITPTFSRFFTAQSTNNIFTTDTVGLGFNAQQSPSTYLDLRIGTGLGSSLNTLQLFKDWLGANRPTIYYVLATPTNTQITDATLVAQLNALAGAQAYSGKTVYQTDSATMPAILSVELLQSVGGGEIWDNVGAVWEEGVGGVQTINVETTQTTYPVWTVTGPCSNPTLQNDTTDTIASFDGMIASGQTLTVNFADNTAYLDSAPVAKYVSGYVSLAPGENVIGFNSDGGSTQTSTISWDNIIN